MGYGRESAYGRDEEPTPEYARSEKIRKINLELGLPYDTSSEETMKALQELLESKEK